MTMNRMACDLLRLARQFQGVYGDPYWITVRYPAVCSHKGCGKPIRKGERAFFYPKGKHLLGETCGHGKEAEADFLDHSAMDVWQ